MALKKDKPAKQYHFTVDFAVDNSIVENDPELSFRSSKRLFFALEGLLDGIKEYRHVSPVAHRDTKLARKGARKK
jgi:hypothetical protein